MSRTRAPLRRRAAPRSAAHPRVGRAVALVAFVALAPLLLVALAGAVPTDPTGGATLEASSLALGGVHRLVQAAHAPRAELAAVTLLEPSPLGVRVHAREPRADAPEPDAPDAAPRGALENRRF